MEIERTQKSGYVCHQRISIKMEIARVCETTAQGDRIPVNVKE